MCGITGIVHMEQDLRQQERLLRQMQQTLIRRGPDQEGVFLTQQCAMAHTRLAVMDQLHGRQPMETTAAFLGSYPAFTKGFFSRSGPTMAGG